jgi:hypothetical protein
MSLLRHILSWSTLGGICLGVGFLSFYDNTGLRGVRHPIAQCVRFKVNTFLLNPYEAETKCLILYGVSKNDLPK